MRANLYMQIFEFMKTFLLKIAFLFLGLVIIDKGLGLAFNYLRENAKGGATRRDNYICNEMTCDLLLLGSSRCEHHYNPLIFEDSLHMDCYNSGQSGNGIIVAYARYMMMCERKKKAMVIYDITPDFDLLAGFDNHRYLTWLRSYYDKDYVRDIFASIDPTEKYKMLSQLYCYNSRFIEILIDYIHPISDPSIKGYVPLLGEMDKSKINENEINKHCASYVFDPLKIRYIEKLIDQIGKDNIIFTISPIWYGIDSESYQPLVDICNEKGVRVLDFANDSKYVHNDIYFKDGKHLNGKGADAFSQELINYLK